MHVNPASSQSTHVAHSGHAHHGHHAHGTAAQGSDAQGGAQTAEVKGTAKAGAHENKPEAPKTEAVEHPVEKVVAKQPGVGDLVNMTA